LRIPAIAFLYLLGKTEADGQNGKMWFNIVKALRSLQRWSYSFEKNQKEKPMKNYKTIICITAAVCLLGAAAFCGYHIYEHYAHRST
jgi:hypothetical protein